VLGEFDDGDIETLSRQGFGRLESNESCTQDHPVASAAAHDGLQIDRVVHGSQGADSR